jgi:hypothetical protein
VSFAELGWWYSLRYLLSRLRLILPVFCVCGRLSLGLLLYIASKSLSWTKTMHAFCNSKCVI